jgi:succinyl-diaminopimelate desuccinylase
VKTKVVPKEKAVSLLQRVLRANTVNPPGNELETALILRDFFEGHGVEAEVDEFLPGRANLIARLPGNDAHRGSLMLCGHMDVVPVGGSAWDMEPFAADLRDDRIYGRGASDMKSGLVATAVAVANLKQSDTATGDIMFVATAGEEVDCCGARRLVERGMLEDAEAAVVAEPTRGDVVLAHKGALWVEIATRGKTAHGSMPQEGVNAIEHMYRVLGWLLEEFEFAVDPDPVLGEPTLNVSVVNGGVKVNVVPDECRLQIDIRTVPAQDHGEILGVIERRLESFRRTLHDFDCEMTVLSERLPVNTSTEERLARVAEDVRRETYGAPSSRIAAPYYTDASVLVEARPDLPVVVCGPGDDRLAHQPNEWVSTEAFDESIAFYERLAAAYFR